MDIPHMYLNDLTATVSLFRLVEFIMERKLEEASKGKLFATSKKLFEMVNLLQTSWAVSAFSLILSKTGKINFQTGKAILLHVEFQEFQAILNGN